MRAFLFLDRKAEMITIDLDSLAGFQITRIRVNGESSRHDYFGPAVRMFADLTWHDSPDLTAQMEALVALNPDGARIIWFSWVSSTAQQLSWPEGQYVHDRDQPDEVPAPVEDLTRRLLCALAIRSVPALRRHFAD